MSAQPNTQPRAPREEVIFSPNTPVTVALKYAQGRVVSGKNGERMMFSTTDNRVFFVDLEVAQQIGILGVNVREPFTVTQHWDGVKGSPRSWSVARIGQGAPASVGQQPDGTFAVPKLPEEPARREPARATAADPRTRLVDEANALVDAYAEVLSRALTKHEGRIKPDEVRSIVLSAYIQRRQLSSVA